MVQVVPTQRSGCVDILEPKQCIQAGYHADRMDAALWAEVRQSLGWEDGICLVCHMGHKSRYGMIGL
eukprot:159609-Pyramimonas_sp.AAC.1